MRYLLCNRCRRAWTAPRAELCCFEIPIECVPNTYDVKVWFRARMACVGWRGAAAVETANYGEKADFRRSLYRGALARGNRIVKWRAVA